MRRKSRKLLTIIVVVILFLPCFTLFLSVNIISKSYAQDKAADSADKIKAILLRPGGWWAEYHDITALMHTTNIFIFEDRGENIVVNINVIHRKKTCESNVTITSDVVKMDGCHTINISLFYDPNDHEYPFKGENQYYKFKLKAK